MRDRHDILKYIDGRCGDQPFQGEPVAGKGRRLGFVRLVALCCCRAENRMALFDKQLDLVTEGDLNFLVENREREGYQIEYKRSVSFGQKQDKLDFLASITSFANTVGGDLLIGVAASDGVPDAITGWVGVNLDQEKLRIENLLRDQVEPRVAFKVHEVSLSNRNTVVLLRVPWSWAQPHMVRMDQVNRFYYRHSAGKDIMNVNQLRAAFALTSRLDEQIARFHRDRTNGIKSGIAGHLTPPPGAAAIMHVMPLESFRFGFTLDPEAAMEQAQGRLLPLGAGSNGYRYSLDGIYCFDDLSPCNAYALVYRNGVIETVNRTLLTAYRQKKLVPCGAIPEKVLQFLGSAMAFYRELNVPPPFAVILTLTSVSEYNFATGAQTIGGYYTSPVDRDDLPLPAVMIQDFSASPIDICRPMFDALFNAAGLPKWPS